MSATLRRLGRYGAFPIICCNLGISRSGLSANYAQYPYDRTVTRPTAERFPSQVYRNRARMKFGFLFIFNGLRSLPDGMVKYRTPFRKASCGGIMPEIRMFDHGP